VSDALLLELSRRVADLEQRMAALEGGGPAAAPTAPDADPQVRALLQSGNKIEAIKRYRELTGVGLAEAKDAVEAIERGVRLQ
jgi:ribosomal protein L7/L12